MRKTKIICTIGPASEKPEVIDKMIEAGMNVARLNFSHGTYAEHQLRIDNLRQAAARSGRPLAIMLDTKGPEIRTGLLRDGKIILKSGQRFVLTTREVQGDNNEVFINYPNLPQEVKKGTSILVADGLINLQVVETTDSDIICSVINGGELGERKGINVPGVRINMPFLSPKDIDDINFGIDNEIDFIAASFATTADDILDIKRLLEKRHADIEIIAKIESQSGVDNLDDMIKIADGVMVARGDLGVEIPAEDVPLVQKIIVEKCHPVGKMVIIATQMLDSMILNPRPTRAEVSDVANAIFDGADAIMLSGETAAGKYPVEVVETMARIAKRAEEALPYEEILRKKRTQGSLSVTDAISYATCATAMSLEAAAIISATRSGYTAKMVAKYRPLATIIAVTPDRRIFDKLALVWGVYPVLIPETPGTDDLFEQSVKSSLESGYIEYGDMVVLTAGLPTGFSGATNLLKVHIVGKILVKGMGIGFEPVSGCVKVIKEPEDLAKIKPGDIVVTRGADRSLAPYLDIIAAIIAEEGGLTSDSAIMGLNAKIPVIVGAKDATNLMVDGMEITLDTQRGIVYEGKAMVR